MAVGDIEAGKLDVHTSLLVLSMREIHMVMSTSNSSWRDRFVEVVEGDFECDPEEKRTQKLDYLIDTENTSFKLIIA